MTRDQLTHLNAGDVVEVAWLDSIGNGAWQDIDDARRFTEKEALTPHYSVGYLLSVTDDVFAIVRSRVDYSATAKNVEGTFAIPLVAVLEVWTYGEDASE